MSHIATVTLNLEEAEKEQLESICTKNIKYIKSLIESKKYKNEWILQKSIQEIQNIKNNIQESITVRATSNEAHTGLFKLELDKIRKLIANVIKSIDYEQIEYHNIKNFEYYVYEFGSLAYIAQEWMIQNKIDINEENFSNKIDELIRKRATNEELKVFKSNFYSQVSKLNNDKLKELLIDKVKNIKTKKEIADFEIWFDEKIDSIEKTRSILEPFLSYLNKYENYNLQSSDIFINNEKIYVKYNLVNKIGEEITFIVAPEGTIEYKIGDYYNHLCNQTASNMIKYINQYSKMKVINHTIHRTFVPEPPKYKAKEKIKRWGV